MSDINWGILQPLSGMSMTHTAEPQANSAPVLQSPAPSNGGGLGDLAQMQQVQIEKQKFGLLQQENARQQGLYPGQLSLQQAQVQEHQLAAQTAKEEYTFHQADLQAYKRGGLDSYQKSLESHDPMAANTLKSSVENAQESIRKNGVLAVDDTANLWHTIVPSNYNPNDPQSQAELMRNYTNNKTLLARLDPKLSKILGDNPTPSQVSNYAMGTVHTVYGYKQQTALQNQIQLKVAEKNLSDSTLKKAQNEAQQAQAEYDAMPDKTSPEAQAAKTRLDQLNQGVQAEISGHSPTAQATGGIVNAVSNAAHAVGKSIQNLGNKASVPTNNFQPGQTAIDANGIKAQYIGGDPKDPKSWKEVQ